MKVKIIGIDIGDRSLLWLMSIKVELVNCDLRGNKQARLCTCVNCRNMLMKVNELVGTFGQQHRPNSTRQKMKAIDGDAV